MRGVNALSSWIVVQRFDIDVAVLEVRVLDDQVLDDEV